MLAEKNKPEYPGAFTSGEELPITAEAAETIRKALTFNSPAVFDPESGNKIDDVSAQFSVLSMILMAIHPKTGEPWMFGMHQCSYPRVWTRYEQLLFQEISCRVVEGLSNLILLRDLKKSELKYRRFFTTVRNGWAYHKTITNGEGVPVDYIFLEVNKAFEDLTGLKGEYIIDKPITEVFSDDKEMLADWINKFGKVSISQESIAFEGYLKSTRTWYSVSVSSPEKGYFITVFEDISERKSAEQILRESEERYALAQLAAKVGTWDWNINKDLLTWSEQIEPMFGFSKGQFSKSYDAFLDCVHPEDRNYVKNSVYDTLHEGKEFDIEHRIIWPDGSIRWLSEKGNVFPAQGGRPYRMLGAVIDITDKKELVERLRTVLDSIDSLVYVADMETYELLFVNKYGRSRWGDFTGKICWQTLQSGQMGPCAFCTNDKLFDADSNPTEPYIWEFQNTVTHEWYECRDQAINWLDGRIVRMEIASNISQRKVAEEQKIKLENQLRQAQKMESVGTLAGGIAHDFNNILSIILGYADMARTSSGPLSETAKELDEVLRAGNRAKELIKQILTFSRQANTERVFVQPISIVEEVVKMLRSSLPTTIEITLDVDRKTGVVFADPTQIQQIVMNLCTNAFHAMEETGGKLDIVLKETRLSAEDVAKEPGVEVGNFVQLSICDSGPGIVQEIQNKIFDPYFTTKEAGKGTGLGLSVVHGIVKSCGGFIALDSEVGKGTAVHVFIPALAGEGVTEGEDTDEIPVGTEHILFVDDEAVIARMGKSMFERLGYKVTLSVTGVEAWQVFQNKPDQFDLIITDQTMPGMTGVELAGRILQVRPDIPIILCTGYSSIISEEKAKALGISEFILKPFSKKDIAKRIRKVLNGESMLSEGSILSG
ncbi:MAG: PAS domain-containing protein [Proteobacteria bacterium]|nr:PAS domain-containing protein [Pseudomonadota bacterium]